jgi:hypothetical protein
LLVFFVNMGFAWHVTLSSTRATSQQNFVGFAPLRLDPASVRLLEVQFYQNIVTSRQLVVIIGMSTGFGMMAIGFALFVLGIESAYSLSGETGPSAKLALSSSSPGLVCFLLSTIIIVMAMTRSMEASLGERLSPTDDKQAQSLPKGSSSANSIAGEDLLIDPSRQ